jgi:DNA-binding response OmpR family regulator
MARLLVVDDEADTVELITFNLKKAGFEVDTAKDGSEALRKVRAVPPSLILLDLMLPQIDGLEVFKLLRRDPSTAGIPIIMVTAKAAEIDRVLGLELGADDYITKPFSPRELVLRVKNLLERNKTSADKSGLHQFDDLFIDIPRHLVKVKGKRTELTATEFRLLTTLVTRRGIVQDREHLLKEVWAYDSLIDTRTVDTHMGRLREKLGAAGRYLETVRGVGYRFTES